MGNAQISASKETPNKLRVLDLSRKVTADDYEKHVNGENLVDSLDSVPVDIIYYDEISLFEEVHLSFNSIVDVPEEFSLRVPHLRLLNVSHNRLTGLPNSFHLFLHMRDLDLSFNRIGTLPDCVTMLSKLETLNVSNNLLTDLPSSISKLKKLQRLNISHNKIRALPEALLECANLSVLVCLNNGLIHPPQSVCDKGPEEAFRYMVEKNIPQEPKSTPQCADSGGGVFVRLRGQQVLVSVSNPESASREYKQAQGSVRPNKKKCPLMVPEFATSLSPDQLTDSILGLIFGACIGDAFGLNMEGLNEQECRFFYKEEDFALNQRICDHIRCHFPPNDWSSNSDLMLLTLDSLMRWGGVVDELEIVSQVIQWLVHGSQEFDPFPGHLLSPLQEQVIGSDNYSVRPHSVASEALQKGRSSDVNPCDNSCLPACVVLGIPNFYKEQEVVMNAERICKATHASPVAVASAVTTALCAAYILQGKFHETKDPSSLLEEIKAIALTRLQIVDDAEKFKTFFTENDFPSDHVARTLEYVSTYLCSPRPFAEAIVELTFKGGPGLSSHCSVLGGILGALQGYSSLPQRWLQQLPPTNLSSLNAKLNHLLDLFGLP